MHRASRSKPLGDVMGCGSYPNTSCKHHLSNCLTCMSSKKKHECNFKVSQFRYQRPFGYGRVTFRYAPFQSSHLSPIKMEQGCTITRPYPRYKIGFATTQNWRYVTVGVLWESICNILQLAGFKPEIGSFDLHVPWFQYVSMVLQIHPPRAEKSTSTAFCKLLGTTRGLGLGVSENAARA